MSGSARKRAFSREAAYKSRAAEEDKEAEQPRAFSSSRTTSRPEDGRTASPADREYGRSKLSSPLSDRSDYKDTLPRGRSSNESKRFKTSFVKAYPDMRGYDESRVRSPPRTATMSPHRRSRAVTPNLYQQESFFEPPRSPFQELLQSRNKGKYNLKYDKPCVATNMSYDDNWSTREMPAAGRPTLSPPPRLMNRAAFVASPNGRTASSASSYSQSPTSTKGRLMTEFFGDLGSRVRGSLPQGTTGVC